MEKELNIILNREDDLLDISSNFQEDLDLLEVEEVAPVILDLLNTLMRKIRRDVVEQEVGERILEDIEDDEAEKIVKKSNEEISNYVGNLFHKIINFVNNKDEEDPKEFDYSLAVYDMDEDNNVKEVYETYHYGKLQEHEKLLSSFAFYKDIAGGLIEKNKSKEEVKQIFKKAFNIMLYNIYNYIEKYESKDK